MCRMHNFVDLFTLIATVGNWYGELAGPGLVGISLWFYLMEIDTPLVHYKESEYENFLHFWKENGNYRYLSSGT